MTYFTPLITVATKTFLYKQGVLIPVSISIGVFFELISTFLLDTSFLGVTTGFLILISVLILIDFWTGVSATHFKYNNLKEEYEKANEEEKKELKKELEDSRIQSNKITFTFFKFIMLFLWIWIAFMIESKLGNIEWLVVIYQSITTIPLVLVSLREYISIGENIKKRYGKMPYIFSFAEKLFDLLQGKFFKSAEIDNTKNENIDFDDY